MQAMILAAGFGTRLRPYSERLPKPLFPLLGRPLLLLHLERLQKAGFDRIVVNCHYKKEMIRDALKGAAGVVLQEEDEILGTGGGLRRALDALRDEPLLVINGDIYHTIDPRWLYNQYFEQEAEVLLAVHHYPRFNGLTVENDRVVSFDAKGNGKSLAFTGMHVLNPAVLEDMIDGRKSCIIEHYKGLLNRGGEIAGIRVDHCYWRDIGTPEDYLGLHGDLLVGSAPLWPEIARLGDSPVHLADEARIGGNFSWKDWCVVGRAEIGENVTICRSVVWDGAVVADGSVLRDSLVM